MVVWNIALLVLLVFISIGFIFIGLKAKNETMNKVGLICAFLAVVIALLGFINDLFSPFLKPPTSQVTPTIAEVAGEAINSTHIPLDTPFPSPTVFPCLCLLATDDETARC